MNSQDAIKAYTKRLKIEQNESYELYVNYMKDIFLAHFIEHRAMVYSSSITINTKPASPYNIFLKLEPEILIKRSIIVAHRMLGAYKPCEYCVMEDGKILH